MDGDAVRFKKPLEFGHEGYVAGLKNRLTRHFKDDDGDAPESKALVIGLFGEWGCGKTAWLKRLEAMFEEDLENPQGDSLTVPVFFNAWRFEKEEHLIVPLLKTAQERLAGYRQRQGFGPWLTRLVQSIIPRGDPRRADRGQPG